VTTETEVSQRTLNSAFMQALGAEFSMLQGARGATISESASRSGLYMTTLSGAVVALALVAQASKFGVTFFIFALAGLFLVHHWRTWMRVAAALPMAEPGARTTKP
jgi:hypothetical protein